MSEPTPAAVDALLDALLLDDDAALAGALADSATAGLPAIEVSPQAAHFLGLLVRIADARRILEIGTLGGYSTICLARAAGPESSVTTLEYEPRHAEVAAVNLRRAGVADRVEIVVGAALDTLPTLSGTFDFVFIDADKAALADYFAAALPLTRPGGLILVDNVVRDGAVTDAASPDANVQGVRRFNAAVAAEPRVSATVLQTVGRKGWDGIAVVWVKG